MKQQSHAEPPMLEQDRPPSETPSCAKSRVHWIITPLDVACPAHQMYETSRAFFHAGGAADEHG